MNEHLRDRISRKLDALTDERGYQVLDYVEFLESRYAERQAPAANPFTRFTEAVEDRLRAGKVSASAIAETMGLMNRAANVLNGALAATRSMATELVTTAGAPAGRPTAQGAEARGASGAAPRSGHDAPNGMSPFGTTPEASSPAHDVRAPGSGEEKL